MFNTLTELQVVMVPAWLFRTVLRNKLNTIDLINYDKLRPIISVDDVAEYLAINDKLKIGGCNPNHYYYFGSMFRNLTPEQTIEWNNSVVPLSGSESISSSLISKLSRSNPMDSYSDTEAKPPYTFITVNTTVFVILEEGFITHMSSTDNMLDFIKLYLKNCYAVAKMSIVHQLPLFGLYIKLLQQKASTSI